MTARAVLERYGTTYAQEAGIRLADAPAPLFQLLVLTELFAARIGALGDAAGFLLDRYDGDLRGLAAAADGDVDRAARLLQEVTGIGPTGAAVFPREVHAVRPWVRPHLDERALAGARRVGLPADPERLAGLVAPEELARFAAGLVRIALLGKGEDPLG